MLDHSVVCMLCDFFFFFFNDTATTEIYTLSLHDALPISPVNWIDKKIYHSPRPAILFFPDRKSTRLNSSHANISYAVFCLKKKINNVQLYFYVLQHRALTFVIQDTV